MIRDLSQTLRAILSQAGLPAELAGAQIVFDRPTEQFKPSQTSVNLFLYDIRENLDLRRSDPTITKQNGQAIFQPPPVRLDCSYLVTAWPVGVTGDELFLQEHRLLSQAFQVLSHYPTIPDSLLQGSLRGQDPPVPMLTSHIDNLKTTGEFWTALGNQLRPSISVTITISLQPFAPQPPVPLVAAVTVQLESQSSPVNPAEFFQGDRAGQLETFRIGGQVTGAENRSIEGAEVTLVESGVTTTTDAEGRYRLGPIEHSPSSPPLLQTLRVQVGTTTRDYPIIIPPPNRLSYNLQFS